MLRFEQMSPIFDIEKGEMDQNEFDTRVERAKQLEGKIVDETAIIHDLIELRLIQRSIVEALEDEKDFVFFSEMERFKELVESLEQEEGDTSPSDSIKPIN